MAQNYIGTPAYTTSITIPIDGELASAASVNNPTKSEADMDYFILQSMGLLVQGSPVRISSLDGLNLIISALPFMIVNENGVYKNISTASPVVLSRTSLEVGPNFIANTWYYVYAFSIAGVANFQISVTPPDQSNLYKQGGDSFRYIGSARTNGLAQLVKFVSNRGQYNYIDTTLQLVNGSSTTELPVTLNAAVPPTSRLVDLHVTYTNNPGLDSYFRLFIYPGGSYQQFIAFGSKSNDFTYSMSTNIDQSIRYLVGVPGTVRLTLSVLGYKE